MDNHYMGAWIAVSVHVNKSTWRRCTYIHVHVYIYKPHPFLIIGYVFTNSGNYWIFFITNSNCSSFNICTKPLLMAMLYIKGTYTCMYVHVYTFHICTCLGRGYHMVFIQLRITIGSGRTQTQEAIASVSHISLIHILHIFI